MGRSRSRSARRAPSPERRRPPAVLPEERVPLTQVQRHFVEKLLGPQSSFAAHVREHHGCGVELDGDRQAVVIRAGPHDRRQVDALQRRLFGMFQLNSVSQERLLSEYRLTESSGGDVRLALWNRRREVATTALDLSALDASREALAYDFDEAVGRGLLANRDLLVRLTAAELAKDPAAPPGDRRRYKVYGTPGQLRKAADLLKRVTTHCAWGASDAKIAQLLDPPAVDSVRLTLSPMTAALPPFARSLSANQPQVSIGKDARCDVHVRDAAALVSRVHAVVELDLARRGVYIIDASTNGTWVNDKKLPAKQSGKVLLFHGDELGLSAESEFGYMGNLQ